MSRSRTAAASGSPSPTSPGTRDATKPGWSVYIVRCADDTLYTGVARNLDARIGEHNAGRGAKYTRGRRPVALVYAEPCADRASAQRREHAIKRMPAAAKRALAAAHGRPGSADRDGAHR